VRWTATSWGWRWAANLRQHWHRQLSRMRT